MTTTIADMVRNALKTRSTARAALEVAIAHVVEDLPAGTVLPGVGRIEVVDVTLSQWRDGSYPIRGRARVLELNEGGVMIIDDGGHHDGHNWQRYVRGAGRPAYVRALCAARRALPAAMEQVISSIHADADAMRAAV